LINKIYNFLHILQNIYIKNKYFIPKKTYSQFGEDLKVKKIFQNKKKGFYVDVGAYHPIKINNTHLLHKEGWRGINIDVSQFSIDLFNFMRPKDLNYQFAVSNKNQKVTLYHHKDHSALNSTHQKTAKTFMKGNLKKKIIRAYSLNSILSWGAYSNKEIDFLDIDVEGADFKVLKGINFKKFKPKLICIEIHKKDYKESLIYKFLLKKKYQLIWKKHFSFLFKIKG
jgi:FkbM family methyltransferase